MFFSQDSIKHTGPAYHTGNGRIVYGGGGITPDIFVPEDTLGMTSYFKEASLSGLILQFAFTYTDDNRPKLNNFKEMMELADYLDSQDMVEKFASYADKRGLKRRNLLIKKSHKLLDRVIDSRIIYNMLDELSASRSAIRSSSSKRRWRYLRTMQHFQRNQSQPKNALRRKKR